MKRTIYELKRLTKSIEEKIEHDFLWKKIDKPMIDEDKLFILSKLVPNHMPLTYQERDVYIITTMLVQIALDTHELVSDDRHDESDHEELQKQLHVLAGDYYSGLYYYLLSEIEDFQFINELASGIKAINELKMRVYYEEYHTFSEYIDLKVKIDSLLLDKVAAYFNHSQMMHLFRRWVYLSLLMDEKESLISNDIHLNELLDVKLQKPYMTNEDKYGLIIDNEWLVFQEQLEKSPHADHEMESYFNQKRIGDVALNTLNVEEG